MRTPIRWAETHAPLFLNGSNLGQKLDPSKRQGLSMEYDEERRHLYVTYDNQRGASQTSRVPETSVLSMIEDGGGVASENNYATTQSVPTNAQVSTPMSHVHSGPGHGQTGQAEPIKRGPGRPPEQVEL